MKKGLLCIILSLLLLVPTFVSCSRTTNIVGTEAPVYTLYTICEEGTKEEDITKVELALNRILFHRLDVVLKLEMVTEDKYEELIEKKYKELEEYQESKKSTSGNNKVYTGDDILKLLEDGKEIPLKQPRLDIFLVRGYDNYYELATKGDIVALDESLANDAKAIKEKIHSTLLNAAKVNNKIYGIPVNNTIGQYTYFVFDNELLEEHGLNPNTVKSLEDLQDYLKTVKANNTDVVPLKSAVPSNEYFHLFEDGFPVLADDKRNVSLAYNNLPLLNYYAMIARYNNLGYIGSEDDSEDTRYAVRIETGDKAELEKKYENSTCVLYSAPVATNETAVDNIFCVSKYVVSNELTAVMKVVAALNTDPDLMNLLTYGVENEHYILTDDGQIERQNENYLINPKYIGNAFITKTLADEPSDKWETAIKQNQDAIPSPSLGFTPSPYKFTYIKDGEEISIDEPDYYSTISSVVEKYYPSLIAGNIDFNYDELYAKAEAEVFQDITAELESHYEDNVLRPQYSEDLRNEITERRGEVLLKEAYEEVMSELKADAKKKLTDRFTAEYKEENPDATQLEINAYVNENLTDDAIDQYIKENRTQEFIDQKTTETAETLLEDEISEAISEIAETASYKTALKNLLNSKRFKDELSARKEVAKTTEIISKIDGYIVEQIKIDIVDVMMAEINTELENLANTYFEDNKELLGFVDLDDFLKQIGYLIEEIKEETESTEGEEPAEPTYVPKYETWFEFVYNDKILATYTAIFGEAA